MKPDNISEAKRWFLQALRDIDDAEFNCDGKRFNLACFLAQQAAEKALKAYLYSQDIEDVWGHSVVELCDNAVSFDNSFSYLKKKGAYLDRFYIPTRYPNGLPGGLPSDAYEEEDGVKAIASAKEIIEAVRKKKF